METYKYIKETDEIEKTITFESKIVRVPFSHFVNERESLLSQRNIIDEKIAELDKAIILK